MAQDKPIDIIGVPLDLGVRELGLKLGPDTFREVGLMKFARQAGLDVRDLGDLPVPSPSDLRAQPASHADVIAACCRALAEMTAKSARAGHIPVCLGGDHSLAIGSIAGVAAAVGAPPAQRPLGCIWLDAHGDANTPETSPSGNVHGMPVAVLLGHGPEALVGVAGKDPALASGNVRMLGMRDLDPGEIAFLGDRGVQMYTVFDMVEQGLGRVMDKIVDHMNEGLAGVHVSLDLDVLREDIAPGVGIPSRCGLDMREATYVCQRIAAECDLLSVDVVGLNPVRDRHFETAKRAVELLLALLGKSFSFHYQDYLKAQH